MSWKHIPASERLRLAEAYLQGDELALAKAGSHYHISIKTLERDLQRWIDHYRDFVDIAPPETKLEYLPDEASGLAQALRKERKKKVAAPLARATTQSHSPSFVKMLQEVFPGVDLPQFPPSPSPRYEDEVLILEGDAILISDVEVPDYQSTMLYLAVAMGMAHGIRRLIIVGDFTAQDPLSCWGVKEQHERLHTFYSEYKLATDVLLQLMRWFDEIVIVEGNHDRRVNKVTNGEVYIRWLLDMTFERYQRRPQVTRFNKVYLDTVRGPWLLAHPLRNSSGVPGALPKRFWLPAKLPPALQAKWGNIKPHVATAHTHLACITHSPDGQNQLMELGCVRDYSRTEYVQDASAHTAWVNALGMVKNGIGKVCVLDMHDWEDELGHELYLWVQSQMTSEEKERLCR